MPMMTLVQASREALRREMTRRGEIFVLGAEVRSGGVFGQYSGLATQFGAGRVIDTPLAETAMLGAAVGAALMGCRPVVEAHSGDVLRPAMDDILSQAAKSRFLFGEQGRAPIILRAAGGLPPGAAARRIPGFVVTAPASPADAAGLLLTALRGDAPVIQIEAGELWRMRGAVDRIDRAIPFGSARPLRSGNDATLLVWSGTVKAGEDAAALVARHGVTIDLLDLRTLWPWDKERVLASVHRTGRLVIAHDGEPGCCLSAEIAETVAQELRGRLESAVSDIGAFGNSPRPMAAQIAAAVAALCDFTLEGPLATECGETGAEPRPCAAIRPAARPSP